MGREKEEEITTDSTAKNIYYLWGRGREGGIGKDEEEEDGLVEEKAPGRQRKGRQRSGVG